MVIYANNFMKTVENFTIKTIDKTLIVIYNRGINLIKEKSMNKSKILRQENDKLLAKIEQQEQQILTLMDEIKSIIGR